jgi:hypothetical protein
MATLNVQYTIETHVGSIPKTTINGFPCPWRQDVMETIIPLLSNLTADSIFLDVGSLETSMSYLASLTTNGSLIYTHNSWIASGWEDQGYPPDEALATFWDYYSSIRTLGLQRKTIPIRGMVRYTLGIHEPASIDLAFVPFHLLGIDYIVPVIDVLRTRMKPGGVIIALENYPNNPTFDKILETVPNSQQIILPSSTAQLTRRLRFMSITC